MEKPTFSIIMPTYKTPPCLLTRAIESVISQTFENWELIVVDDNSANSSFKREFKDIINKYENEPRLIAVCQDDNYGANVARNTAINRSAADWLAFLDADDAWDAGYLNDVVNYIGKEGVVIVSTPIRVDNGSGVWEIPHKEYIGDISEVELFGDVLSPSSGICARKDVLKKAGGFDEALPARQDYDMWLRMSFLGNVAFCPNTNVTVYRDDHQQISDNYMNHIEGTRAVISKIEAMDQINESTKQRAVEKQLLYICRVALRNNDGLTARTYAKKMRLAKHRTIMMFISFLTPLSSVVKWMNKKRRFKK